MRYGGRKMLCFAARQDPWSQKVVVRVKMTNHRGEGVRADSHVRAIPTSK